MEWKSSWLAFEHKFHFCLNDKNLNVKKVIPYKFPLKIENEMRNIWPRISKYLGNIWPRVPK